MNLYIYVIIIILYFLGAFLWNLRYNKEKKLMKNRLDFYNKAKVLYQFFYKIWGGSYMSLILTNKKIYFIHRVWFFGYYLGRKWILDNKLITKLSIRDSKANISRSVALQNKMFIIKFHTANKVKKAKIIGTQELDVFLNRLKKLNHNIVIEK